MSELFFPVVGALSVFFVAVPALTLCARLLIWSLPAARDEVLAHVRPWRFALIVGPTLGPVIWLASAAAHQSERGAPLAACLIDHLGGELCRDVVAFGLLLLGIPLVGAVRRARRTRAPSPAASPAGTALATRRVHSVCSAHPALSTLACRVRVVSAGVAPACTRGLLFPRVELEAALVDGLSDEELRATLLHELEHALAHDPLRFFIAQVALSTNPLGRLLDSDMSRYHFAREALCDRRAVQRGADPLALARSIVSVASPRTTPRTVADLGGHGIAGVRVRVQLLLGYAARRPGPAGRSAPTGLSTVPAAALAALPHLVGTGPLDLLHHGVERMALLLGLG